jgi:transcriptional regulator NrdR family protein
MQCPKCKSEEFKVTCSNAGLTTTRIRKCVKCGHSIHTIESVKYDNYTKSYAKELIDQNEIGA